MLFWKSFVHEGTSVFCTKHNTTFFFLICAKQVAGITRPTSDVSISMAEEALEQLQGRVATLERELQDLQHKVLKIYIYFFY